MTGWRIGYAAANAEIIGAMNKIHQYTMLCAPIMAQEAAIEALRKGANEVEGMVAEYDQRRRFMIKRLRDIGFSCFEPKGAFYNCIDSSIRKEPIRAGHLKFIREVYKNSISIWDV